jgi:hypothetical protein
MKGLSELDGTMAIDQRVIRRVLVEPHTWHTSWDRKTVTQ